MRDIVREALDGFGSAHWSGVVGESPHRFEPTISTVHAGEPSAESFDRLPPRQLAPLRESWRSMGE